MKGLRRHLGWKLFFSYLIVILIGVISLAITAEWHAPTALSRHMANMQMMMNGGLDDSMMADLLENFSTAINEVLLVAAAIATVTAVFISTFVTRRIISPVRAMKDASQRIANGRYDERVQVTGDDELADLGRSFNQMAHTLAQTEERRRQLIGDVAHELRTPLSSMKSVIEGLQDGVLPAESATILDIQHELGRLQRLVRDLEELSRAEVGQIPLEFEPVNPSVFIQTAVDRLRHQFEDKGVQLKTDIPATLSTVQADAGRMTQVMLNLLGNALQYTPSGGQVVVHCSLTDNHLLIAVEDNGIGMTVEQQRHIFERFYRVDKSRSRTGGGSGIGLTIGKHLVEAHNGRLTVSSPGLNQGSTFTISVPIVNI